MTTLDRDLSKHRWVTNGNPNDPDYEDYISGHPELVFSTPKPTNEYASNELEAMGYVGMYLPKVT